VRGERGEAEEERGELLAAGRTAGQVVHVAGSLVEMEREIRYVGEGMTDGKSRQARVSRVSSATSPPAGQL
jgi:hypothetical protein